MRRALRPHQISSIEKIRDALRAGYKRPLLQLPTGAGKSKLAAAIAEGAYNKAKRVLFTVPALSLIPQTLREFQSEGIEDIGVIQGRHEMTDWGQPIQIASIQTLMRRQMPDANVVMVDEAHVKFNFYDELFKWADARKVPVIGLSATPYSKGLGKPGWFDHLITGATTQGLIDDGYLCDFKVFAPSHPDLSQVRTIAGDYHEGDISGVLDKPELVGDIVDTWLRLGENRSTFCFAVNRAHAKHIQERFIAKGVSAEYMDCFSSAEEREEIFRRYRDGDVRVICNCSVLSIGVDEDVRCIILALGTKSLIKFQQIVGRGLRTAEAKQDVRILDHADNHTRLGFVTEISIDHLDDGESGRKKSPIEAAKLPKECPKCSFLRPPRLPSCPNCGFKPETKSKISCQDGDLVELSRSKADQEKILMEDKKRFYGELRTMAAWKGYKDGWIANQYREKYGVWPIPSVKAAPKREPTMATEAFVKSRIIKYIKGKEKDQRALRDLSREGVFR